MYSDDHFAIPEENSVDFDLCKRKEWRRGLMSRRRRGCEKDDDMVLYSVTAASPRKKYRIVLGGIEVKVER